MRSIRKSRQDRAGFTLVELIVVIVILGILAGVAYGGYTQYIEHARRAGDEEYIGAVNEALAAACQEQGVDTVKLRPGAAEVSWIDTDSESDAKTDLTTLTLHGDEISLSSTTYDDVKSSFENLFENTDGNSEMKLKYYKSTDIIFLGKGKMFVGTDSAGARKEQIWGQSGFSENPEQLKEAASSLKNFFESATSSYIPESTTIEDALKNLPAAADEVNFDLNISDQEKADIIKFFEEHGLTGRKLNRTELGNGLTAYIASRTADPENREKLLKDIREKDVVSYEDEKSHQQNYKQSEEYEDPLLAMAMQMAALEAYCNSGNASDGFIERFKTLREGYSNGTAGLEGLLKMQTGTVSIFKSTGGVNVPADELERYQAYKQSKQFDMDMEAYFDVMEKAAGNIGSGSLEDIFSFLDG